jgi:hypothetical protein
MKLIKQILAAAKATPGGLLKSWAKVCSSFFETVTQIYPHLIKTNLEGLSSATLDLIEKGETDNPSITRSQYPNLPLSEFSDPVFQALYELGAVQLHPSGVPVVDPTPAVLLRGLARLALPKKFLIGIVNASRSFRGYPPLTESEFDALDKEMFFYLRRGIEKSFGEGWFVLLDKGAKLLHRAMVLPCLRLRGSQEFYEEGINFYSNQGSDSEVYIYSTTSGLIIPREFKGDANKNLYRYNYFTKGILGHTSCNRIYQWELFRTATELARGYNNCTTNQEKQSYLSDACNTLRRFGKAPNLAIYEVDNFESWKEWFTLIGPEKQQLSIRPKEKKGIIGHGISFDAIAFRKRSDLLRDIGIILSGAGVISSSFGHHSFLNDYGPAFEVAAASCLFTSAVTERIGRLLREPVLRKARIERDSSELPGSNVRRIKQLGEKIEERKIIDTVDRLLEAGNNLLTHEQQKKI